MIYIYVATRVITFFGTVLRTFWEHIACRIASIAAEDIRAFKVDELCGHVEHELCETKKQAFTMCFLPFFLNFIIGCCLLLSGSYRVIYAGDLGSIKYWVFLYMGISCLANCVPSFEDVLSFKDMFYNENAGKFLKVILAPFYSVIYVGALLERYSLTFVLAIAFAFVFPHIFNVFFPAIATVIQMVSE